MFLRSPPPPTRVGPVRVEVEFQRCPLQAPGHPRPQRLSEPRHADRLQQADSEVHEGRRRLAVKIRRRDLQREFMINARVYISSPICSARHSTRFDSLAAGVTHEEGKVSSY